jgi:hypothetical protein
MKIICKLINHRFRYYTHSIDGESTEIRVCKNCGQSYVWKIIPDVDNGFKPKFIWMMLVERTERGALNIIEKMQNNLKGESK